MADPFVAEIRMFCGNFAPFQWALCNGQILAISQNTALFSLIGTFYGGNGTSTFGLPNLQGCVPMATGQGPGLTDRVVGEQGGETGVTIDQNTLASHTHQLSGRAVNADTATPTSATALARPEPALNAFYKATATNVVNMSPSAVSITGGAPFPHNNMQPYLAITFIIALVGIFPARN